MAAVCTSVFHTQTVARSSAPRMSDKRLLTLKAVLMVVAVSALLCASQVRAVQAWGSLTNEWQGVSIRYPKHWWAKKEGICLATVISESKGDHMQISPALAPAPLGVQVRIERVAAVELGVSPSISPETLARAAARYIGVEHADASRRTALMDRPAIELSGPRPGGWGAVIAVEDGDTVVLLQVAAPSQSALETARATWRAIAASVRPVPVRSNADLSWPPADPSDPGWGPGEENGPLTLATLEALHLLHGDARPVPEAAGLVAHGGDVL